MRVVKTFGLLIFAALAWGYAEIAYGSAFRWAAADRCKQRAKMGGVLGMASYSASLDRVCERFGCEPSLVAALITVESRWNPYAVRFEPGYQWLHEPERYARQQGISLEAEQTFQRFSWGLMQIMGGTAREMGFSLPLPALCEGMIGIEYGIRYLVALKRNYKAQDDLIAAYNSGSAKKKANGKYINQEYVDKVNWVLRKHDGSR